MMRRGDWMQTATGGEFWPLDPKPEEVFIEDIAHALSNMCRFSGHCREFYSVAQHSVLVSEACPEGLKLWGLLHDAAEAYVVDIPRPLKTFLSGYKKIEGDVMAAIVVRFGLFPFHMPAEVKQIDNAILSDEAAQIMETPPREWFLPEPALGINITPWSPNYSRSRFMRAFNKLHEDFAARAALKKGDE